MKNENTLYLKVISSIKTVWSLINRVSQKKIVRYTFQLIAIGFIYYLVKKNYASFQTITQPIKINFLFLLFAFLILLFIVIIIGGSSWFFINKGLGQKISFFEAVCIQSFSNISKYIPGTIWQYVSKIYLSKKKGIVNEAITIAIGYEIGQTIWIGICIMLITFPGNIKSFQNFTILPQIIAFAGIIGFFVSFTFPFWAKNILQKIMGNGFKVNSGPLVFSALLIFLGWILSIIGFWIMSESLSNSSIGSISAFGFTYSSALIGGLLAIPIPNGFGVREGIMVITLQNILPEYLAVILAGISRVEIILAELTAAIIIWIISQIRVH